MTDRVKKTQIQQILSLAMPTARAIRYKSGLAPASTLRAFRFYPYCFCAQNMILVF